LPGSLPISLLQRSSLRFMAHHKRQSWLTFTGIMLGVTMVVAVDLANSSARRAFALSLTSVAGNVTHQIVGGPLGIDEHVYSRIRTELAIRNSAPMVTGVVRIKGQNFRLIGSDPISEATIGRHVLGLHRGELKEALLNPNAVVLSERGANRLELSLNQTFSLQVTGREPEVKLVATFAADNPAATEGLIFTDIANAQTLLQRWGRLDRIDLVIDRDDQLRLEAWLPDELKLVESDSRNQSMQQMSDAFHINLTAMSLLALLVATLLIYNTMTLSVIQRRRTLGIYRTLGVSRGEIFNLVLSESLALAVIASAAGLVAGLLLGQLLVQLVTRTINDLYFSLHVSAFLIDPWSLLKGFSLGIVMTLISAFLPAWEANRTEPIAVQQRSALEEQWRSRLPFFVTVGLVFLLLGMLLVNREHGSLLEGFAALTMIVMGFCLVIPSIVVVLSRATILVIAPLPYQIVRIAIRGISSGISRTGLAVAALTVAVSVTVGVGIMVGSFRHTVAVWLDQALVGDIYISPTGLVSDDALRRVKQQLTGVDGIKHVVGSRVLNAESEFGPLRLMARTLTDVDTGMPMKEAVPGAEQLFLEGQGVLVSEPLAYHRQRGPGDTISLHTSEGPRQFPIVGVYFDYTSSQGMVVMQHELYRHWWSDDSLTGLTVVGKQGVTADKLLSETRRAIGLDLEHFTVISNGEIRQVALSVFDRTFVITDVMRLLAILVAAVSVLSALIALQLERTREFGILRATGMTPGQIRLMIIVQTLLIGLFAGLLAIPLGLLMAEVLIEVINRRAFGWSMQQTLPVDVLIQAMVLALGSAFLAGLYPAHKAATISPSMALREE